MDVQELNRLEKTSKNAIKISIGVGFVSIFFAVLNLSILLSEVGASAGIDRKIKAMQIEIDSLKSQLNTKP